MKRTLCFLLVALLYILQVSAQDTLVYRNGKREVARVLEVGEFTIRYNLLGTSNEPDRAVSRLDLQSIHFHNGKIEQFERPSRSDDPLLVRRLRIEEELGDSKWAFFGEIGGSGILSVNGDYRIYKDALAPLAVHIRIGAGIYPDKDPEFTIPITASVVTGRLYKFEMGWGITPAFPQEGKAELIYSALLGLRYQRKNGLFGRIAFTPLAVKSLREYEINPFVGLALGMAF
jgi:hypothetical protein